MKTKKKSSIIEQVKAARKQSREEELKTHGKAINYRKVIASKTKYNRKKNKADDEVLPYLFLRSWSSNSDIYHFEKLGTHRSQISPNTYPFFNWHKHFVA